MNSQYVIGLEIDKVIEQDDHEKKSQYSNEVNLIRGLEEKGVQFHVITERKCVTDRNLRGYIARRNVTKYLKRLGLNFKSIQFCDAERSRQDKLLACRKLGVDAMIECRWDTALFLAQNGIYVFFLANSCQLNDTNTSYPNLFVVKGLGDIKTLLLSLPQPREKEFVKIDKEQLNNLTVEEKSEYFRLYQRHLQQQDFDKDRFIKSDRRFHILFFLLKFPIRLLFCVKSYGSENIPFQNGFIIACNHCDSLDQYWLGMALGNRPFVGYAAKEIARTLRGRLFSYTGLGIFIDRDNSEDKKTASEVMASYVANNRTAFIFPEGTRKNKTEEGRALFQLRFKPGTVVLAQKIGTGILPVAVNVFGHTAFVRFGQIVYVTPNDSIDEKNRELELAVAYLSYKNISKYLTDKGRDAELEIVKTKYRAYVDEITS
ncbi:MAG: 1-acyl-sn-glycerol-3-phosphate acyltransferase [Lachnospiraceae bacterium]|nr:1-acyl-sn-glycerol-3-phosphate acyltransferase [Lachnospiraceae bacterium]